MMPLLTRGLPTTAVASQAGRIPRRDLISKTKEWFGAITQEILKRNGEVVVRVHQAGGARHDAVAVGIGIVAPGDVEIVLELDQSGHGVRAGTIHADFAVVVPGK